MSYLVTLHCDAVVDEYGSSCAARTAASDVAQVNAQAVADGWIVGGPGQARCPIHSGRPRGLRERIEAGGDLVRLRDRPIRNTTLGTLSPEVNSSGARRGPIEWGPLDEVGLS